MGLLAWAPVPECDGGQRALSQSRQQCHLALVPQLLNLAAERLHAARGQAAHLEWRVSMQGVRGQRLL